MIDALLRRKKRPVIAIKLAATHQTKVGPQKLPRKLKKQTSF